MKKMQSYRIEAETIKQIDELAQKTMRTKSNVIEVAIKEYYQNLEDEMEDNRLKVLYDGEVIGYITTNKSLTIDEALSLIEIDPNEIDGGDPKYDFELFELQY